MNDESITKAIRSLTIAVWALVVVTVITTIIPLLWLYIPFGVNASFEEPRILPGHFKTGHQPDLAIDEFEGFHDWPIEKQIAAASAIVLTTHENDGVKLTSKVSEILKLELGTTLYYKIGDEYQQGTRYLKEDVSYGDGEIIFFTGSPAQMRYSSSYDDGRCRGIGDMPIEMLKEMIVNLNGKPVESSN